MKDLEHHNSELKRIAKLLHQTLVKNGWTQSELARRAQALAPEGVRIGTDSISHYVNARYAPSAPNAVPIAKALGIDPGDLLVRSIDASPPSPVKMSLGNVALVARPNGMARLTVNIDEEVSFAVGLEVLRLLRGVQPS